jgi:hypothetical protein
LESDMPEISQPEFLNSKIILISTFKKYYKPG